MRVVRILILSANASYSYPILYRPGISSARVFSSPRPGTCDSPVLGVGAQLLPAGAVDFCPSPCLFDKSKKDF